MESFIDSISELKFGYIEVKPIFERWDDAEHHREIHTFQHHVHIEDEKNVQPSEKMTLEKVLDGISDRLSSS